METTTSPHDSVAPEDRRTSIRKPCAFDVSWVPSGAPEMRGHGFDVSLGGMTFALPAKNAPAELDLKATIRGKTIELSVAVLRKDAIVMHESFWTKFACRITKVDPQGWEEIVESIPVRAAAQTIPAGVEAVFAKKAKAPEKPAAPPLPIEIKEKIAKLMVKRERMEPWRQGQPPAISFSHVGEEKDPLGRTAQHYKVDTTRQRHGKPESLSTIVAVVEGGEIMIVRE